MTTSRLTFRDKSNEIAWQKQLRDKYASEEAPNVELSLKTAVIRPVSRKLAEQIILKYEWLGTMAATNHHHGIFFGLYCAGVTCVSIPYLGASASAHLEWGLDKYEFAYLARGANVHWSPQGANSKLVSWTCKLLARNTKAKLIIAYSDTDAGEIGTIYQACNWICVGRGSSTKQWVSPDGVVRDNKYPGNLAKRFNGKRSDYANALRDAGWYEQDSNPKWRYVYVLDKSDKRLTNLVESKRTEYPKR